MSRLAISGLKRYRRADLVLVVLITDRLTRVSSRHCIRIIYGEREVVDEEGPIRRGTVPSLAIEMLMVHRRNGH